jgi:hypothetical protein
MEVKAKAMAVAAQRTVRQGMEVDATALVAVVAVVAVVEGEATEAVVGWTVDHGDQGTTAAAATEVEVQQVALAKVEGRVTQVVVAAAMVEAL